MALTDAGARPASVASMVPASTPSSFAPTPFSEFSTALKARRAPWDDAVPPVLRPLVRAYLLGYASAVAPRLLTLLLQHGSRSLQRLRRPAPKSTAEAPKPRTAFLEDARRIMVAGLDVQRFPTFCAALVGGSTLLEIPLRRLLQRIAGGLTDVSRTRLSRWLASFIAGWLSLQLLQSKISEGFTETIITNADSPPGVVKSKTSHYAGRTLDLSLFAATRAVDVIVGELWSQHRARRRAKGANPTGTSAMIETAIARLADPAVFAASAAIIMWTWIYRPARLPRAYNKWIGSAAAVDARLIEALQRCRSGSLVYGKDTGQAPLLQAMCTDYKWPQAWGDPAVAVPFPCDMVHMGSGPSCERHAARRFLRSFRWAFATYLPLNLLLVARRPNARGLLRALLSASRSSAFLGAFITLFYYGVCLARTRLGPRVLGSHTSARQHIDSGLCVGSGCALCGWSILLENPGRRKDMSLFVAPRALATFFPRRYDLGMQWRETAVFAFSTAVVFTCVLENKRRVRGVLGGVLATVMGV